MKRRFVIATNSLDVKGDLEFAQYLTNTGGSWWHWIDNFWLFATDDEEITASSIRDWLQKKKLESGRRIFVVEIPTGFTEWAGVYPKSEEDSFKWLRAIWDKNDPKEK